jgi:hypothetical protein
MIRPYLDKTGHDWIDSRQNISQLDQITVHLNQ